jgi:DNA (cytosine-5)-methyltransferase 1
MSTKKVKVVELFAGVGGFRLGLEGWKGKSATSLYKKPIDSPYQVVFSNQFEPSTKTQHASMVYEAKWGKSNHNGNDINEVDLSEIPEHEMLVGGFPCQDYSVATTLKNSKGLIGKKGVLWWAIHKILAAQKKPTKYLLLENVDRLLISPAKNRGRDFAIILQSLNELDYCVEWRVVNAADFGFPQRRKRVFILAYHKSTKLYKLMTKTTPKDYLLDEGVLARALPITITSNEVVPRNFKLSESIVDISANYNSGGFENSGIMISGNVYHFKSQSNYDGKYMSLKDVVIQNKVEHEFYLNEDDFDKWQYLKGAKKEVRKNASGFEYFYSEGGMVFPDSLDKPSRTIITGEGGASPSRFKHVIKTKYGHRRLTPVELERLNMFPDNHTQLDSVSDTKRAFFMGNALVVGVVEKITQELKYLI